MTAFAADDNTETDKVAATVAVGGAAGVGAAATVTVEDKHVLAFIGQGANVTADGQTAGLLAKTGGFAVSFVADSVKPPPVTFNPTVGTVNTVNDTINIGSHGFATGDYVTYHKGTVDGNLDVGGLQDGKNYYLRVSGNTVSFYDTKAQAQAGGTTGRANLINAGVGTEHTLTSAVEVIDSKNAKGTPSSSLHQAGQVKSPNVDAVDAKDENGTAGTANPATGQRMLNPGTVMVRGVAISATNRDDIATYSVGIGGGTVGIAVAAAVNDQHRHPAYIG